MDILFVRNLFRPADFGGNRYPWEVTRRLVGRHRVRVVTPRPGGPLPGRTGAEIHHYPVSRRTPFETFFTNAFFSRIEVERQIARHRPDVVVFSSYDTAYGYQLAPLHRIPTVYIYHSSFYSPAVDRVGQLRAPLRWAHPLLARFLQHVERIGYGRATAIVAVSPFSKREIEEQLGAEDDRVRVIPTGVDAAMFSPGDRGVARAELGIPLGARLLVTTGRLAPVKRYDRAIDALQILAAQSDAYQLVIVGDGPERDALMGHARRRGLADRIRFAGHQDGPALVAHYRAADVILCTSDFENWSLAILEALATGTPVIGTPRGSIPDLLGRVDPWLVADDATPAALAAKAAVLATDPVRRDRLGRIGRERVAERYTWDRTVEALERCFEEVAR